MSGEHGDAYAGLEIGRALELARERRGLSLKQVEEATKIRAGYLSDLEQENFDVLPAVYVQGYLKTYAGFLHLDAAALVGEFKRRRSLSEEPPYPLYVGPSEDDTLDDILTAMSGAAGAESPEATGDEEDAGTTLLPAGFDARLYLGSAVFLLLCAAVVVLALNVAGDRRQEAVSHVREPLISKAPETTPPGAGQQVSVQSPRQQDRPQSKDDEKVESQDERLDNLAAQEKKPEPQSSASAKASASPPARTASAAPERDDRTNRPQPLRKDTASVKPPTPQTSTASPSSPSPTRQPAGQPSGGNSSPPPANDAQVQVNVNVGAEDPVQLSGGPFD